MGEKEKKVRAGETGKRRLGKYGDAFQAHGGKSTNTQMKLNSVGDTKNNKKRFLQAHRSEEKGQRKRTPSVSEKRQQRSQGRLRRTASSSPQSSLAVCSPHLSRPCASGRGLREQNPYRCRKRASLRLPDETRCAQVHGA